MFVHLGSDVVVSLNDIIAIFDLESTSMSKRTREFLDLSQKSGIVVDVSKYDLPKSYILCEKNKQIYLYISPLSASTVYKRASEKFSGYLL